MNNNMINHDNIINFLTETLSEDKGVLKKIRHEADKDGIPLLMLESSRFLEVLVKIKRPGKILEAGTATGYSSILMCLATAGQAIVDTVEKDYHSIKTAIYNIKEAGLSDRIRIIAGEFTDVFSNLSGKYDIIFLDAAKSSYIDVLPHCERLLNDTGILVSDNVLYKGMVAAEGPIKHKQRTIVKNMRRYLDYLCNDGSFHTSIIPIGDGISISVKNYSNIGDNDDKKT